MKTSLQILIVLISFISYSQPNIIGLHEENYRFSMTSTQIEIFQFSYNYGKAISGDLGIRYRDNILSFSGSIVEEQVIYGKKDKLKELHLLYGRNYRLIDRFNLEAYSGVGLLFDLKENKIVHTETAFPIVAKLRYNPLKALSIAIKMQIICNVMKTSYCAGLLVKWENI